MNARGTIIGKEALLITAKGKVEIAAQVFNYNHLREVRVDIERLEVKLLMDYDESFFRVYKIIPQGESEEIIKKAQASVLRFYNDLLTAAMKFTREDVENLKKHQEDLRKKIEEKKTSEDKEKVDVKTDKSSTKK